MARRLILDTGVLVRAERSAAAGAVAEDDDVVIAAVTVAELLAGVELADDARRDRRRDFVRRVLDSMPVETYDAGVAAVHARLLAHTRRSGTTRGAHDLMVAATAVTTGRTLLTTDAAARFGDLPGLDVVVV